MSASNWSKVERCYDDDGIISVISSCVRIREQYAGPLCGRLRGKYDYVNRQRTHLQSGFRFPLSRSTSTSEYQTYLSLSREN